MTQKTRAATTRRKWLSTTALVFAGALGVSGCSSVPDAVNPVEWYRGASDAVGGMFGGDEPEAGTTAGDPGTSANTTYPNLATVPGRPTPSTTPEQREALKQGLVADRANARYTEPAPGSQASRTAAAPQRSQPQAQPPATAQQQAASPPLARSQPTAPTAAVPVAPPPATPPPATPPVAASPPPAPPPAAASAPAVRSAAANGGSGLWPNRPPPETPGLRASTTGRVGGDEIHRSAASGETPLPSHVPSPTAPSPAAPSVANRLAERTTYDSAGAGTGTVAQTARSQPPVPPPAPAAPRASDQSVIVNEDAILGTVPAAPLATSFGGRRYLASTIYFGHGSASITAGERQEIARIARAAAANGAAIQVIGHASARTADLSLRDHETANLAMSMKRAQTVADALIQSGMPASRVIVEALADSQPEFYEVMPSGEAGNRRAEIIVIY